MKAGTMARTAAEMEAGSRIVPQLPLALSSPPDQRLQSYLQAPAGLVEQLRALAEGVSDPLYLHGARATGKTHLLVAACAHAEQAGRRPAYLSLQGLSGRVAQAVEGLEAADLLALDDLDAVVDNRADALALFELHNRMRDAGRGLLYAASAPPDGLPVALADLRSRLAQCMRWALPVLDDAGRAQLLRARAAARGLDFDEAALDWMLRRCSRDLGSLTTLFEQLDRASLAAQRRLTVPFLRQVLSAG